MLIWHVLHGKGPTFDSELARSAQQVASPLFLSWHALHSKGPAFYSELAQRKSVQQATLRQ